MAKGENKMGFYVMIFSMLIGIFLIALGIIRRKRNSWYKILIAVGVLLALFAIYLGFPK
ncbi:DUF6095 family protein [Lactobacillus apis]|uniref:DUF6095 family protein n=1 Tax=Lactobacillus apis TaxID=303541 RepID=UPI00242B00BB|nr:DUF6095 family protein [Lactobacillus apis]